MDEINNRGKSMENAFFAERDKALLEKLKADLGGDDATSKLKSVTGIEDDAVLAALAKINISPETLTSVSLIPLVVVAWSDGVIQDAEKTAILKAAVESGIEQSTPAYSILENWLANKPESDLLDSWKSYVGAVKESLDGPSLGQLKSSVINRATKVAEAAGGFLGLGNKVSASEQTVLDELTKTFE
jgi:hypothetical protein